jgi:hypothetical protein
MPVIRSYSCGELIVIPVSASRSGVCQACGHAGALLLQWNGTYQMTPEQRAEWEAGVRSLYDGMVRVVVTPTWAS